MQRGRIKEDISGNYKALLLPGIISGYRRYFNEMMYANKAHVLMLYDCKIINKRTFELIIDALIDIQQNLKEEDLNVDRGDDLYLNVESQVIDRIGSDEGGRMHTARSRNDLVSTLNRMVARKYLLEAVESILELQRLLYQMAQKYSNTIITGYTHMQPAQPTTVGHYLIMCIHSLIRDINRLQQAYRNTNRCALGAAAFAGTGFPIRRQITSQLLGFDCPIENSWDCVTSRDYILEIEADYAIMENSISRMAQDIYTWCTDEFSVWNLGGQVSGQSSIMPQKKNPSSLEYVKSGCCSAEGAFSASFSALKNAAFTFVCDAFRMDNDLDEAQKELLKLLELLKETLRYSSINIVRADKMANQNFCTATGLADLLVRDFNISFRNAHHIVGGMVGDVKERGGLITDICSEDLINWSNKILGYEIKMTGEELKEALSAEGNVRSKESMGGPSSTCISDMLGNLDQAFEEEEKWLNTEKESVKQAYQSIEKAISNKR